MAGATYEVRVEGAVPSALVRELGEVTLAGQELRTVLLCEVPDQAALHGLLARLRAFGLELVEVRAVTPTGGDTQPPEEA